MFTDSTSKPVSAALQDAAEQVRAHLVYLRGGAPFLSPTDGALLLDWLESGHTAAEILTALERAATKRRASRSKVPLKLAHAKPHLGKSPWLKSQPKPLLPTPQQADHPFAPLLPSLPLAMHGALMAIEPGDLHRMVEAGCAVIRQATEHRWTALTDAERAALRDRARERLGDLLVGLKEDRCEALIEESARDLLRGRYPALTAAAVWSLAEDACAR